MSQCVCLYTIEVTVNSIETPSYDGIFPFGATTFSIMTLNIMTFSTMTLNVLTVSMNGLYVTLSIIQTEHNWHSAHQSSFWALLCWMPHFVYCYAECHYVECDYGKCRILFTDMLSVSMLSLIMLNVAFYLLLWWVS